MVSPGFLSLKAALDMAVFLGVGLSKGSGMPKQGEIDYLRLSGEAGIRFARDKPFSAPDCGRVFLDLGVLFSVLPPPPAWLLDLGVGTGWTSVFFGKRGYEVVGQDISSDMIQQADINKARYSTPNVEFITTDYEHLDFQNEFDCAVFYDCLHHAEDEQSALRAVYRALKPGGICVTVEPGRGHASAMESRNAVAHFGVTERDMPPALILAGAKEAGFGGFRVYRRFMEPVELPAQIFTGSHPLALWALANLFALKATMPFQGWRRHRRLLRDARQGSHIVVLTK
jgi:SAM-dependent methyltransferase